MEICQENDDVEDRMEEISISVHLPNDIIFIFLEFLPRVDHRAFQLVSRGWNSIYHQSIFSGPIKLDRTLKLLWDDYWNPINHEQLRQYMKLMTFHKNNMLGVRFGYHLRDVVAKKLISQYSDQSGVDNFLDPSLLLKTIVVYDLKKEVMVTTICRIMECRIDGVGYVFDHVLNGSLIRNPDVNERVRDSTWRVAVNAGDSQGDSLDEDESKNFSSAQIFWTCCLSRRFPNAPLFSFVQERGTLSDKFSEKQVNFLFRTICDECEQFDILCEREPTRYFPRFPKK